MTDAEITDWMPSVWEDHIALQIRTGRPEEVARARADAVRAEQFPGGRPAPGQRLWVVEDDTGTGVARVWVGPHPDRPGDPTAAWLYYIEVDEAHRGQGHGRRTLEAIEAELVRTGVTELGLNVFGDNDTARRLYATSGYRDVAISMSKTLT